MDKNFNANANSKNPKTTLTLLSHPPDLGIDCSMDGNIANRTKGRARAIAKPSIPIAGPNLSPLVAASTSKVPIIGPVHENETNAKEKAIKNKPTNPPLSDLASILFTNELGKVNSNAPRNDAAKNTSIRKNRKLNTPLVLS